MDVLLAVWRYLSMIALPLGFSVEHDWQVVPPILQQACLMLSLMAAMLVWLIRDRFMLPLLALTWLALLMAPRALFGDTPLTEHHTYVPFLAVWVLIGAMASQNNQ